jgi:hypothetical protein
VGLGWDGMGCAVSVRGGGGAMSRLLREFGVMVGVVGRLPHSLLPARISFVIAFKPNK